jgi:hypothetical protein
MLTDVMLNAFATFVIFEMVEIDSVANVRLTAVRRNPAMMASSIRRRMSNAEEAGCRI